MKSNNIALNCLVSVLLLGLFSANANAFTVWAVEGGAAASSNTAGNPLTVSAGTNTIDLYFNTEGDTSLDWDLFLDVTGVGSVSGVNGGDINGGIGTSKADGGWIQSGGNSLFDLNASSALLFSFDFDASAGTLLSIGSGSSYVSGSTFESLSITGGDLVTVSAVPLPAAAWMLLSGAGLLGAVARKKTTTV